MTTGAYSRNAFGLLSAAVLMLIVCAANEASAHETLSEEANRTGDVAQQSVGRASSGAIALRPVVTLAENYGHSAKYNVTVRARSPVAYQRWNAGVTARTKPLGPCPWVFVKGVDGDDCWASTTVFDFGTEPLLQAVYPNANTGPLSLWLGEGTRYYVYASWEIHDLYGLGPARGETPWSPPAIVDVPPDPNPSLITRPPGCATGRTSPDGSGRRVRAAGWSLTPEVSEDDGLVVRDVKLGSRPMARTMSLPYLVYRLRGSRPAFAELRPAADDVALESFSVSAGSAMLATEARYEIDTPGAGCLTVTQRYEFHKPVPGDHCEPTGQLPCARFIPLVKYEFHGRPSGTGSLERILLPQRLHFVVDSKQFNSAGLLQDNDGVFNRSPIRRRLNPVLVERADQVVTSGEDAAQWDNFHQTRKLAVQEPTAFPPRPGCPECVHIHWRWGKATGLFPGFHDANGGDVRIPGSSSQDVSIGIARDGGSAEDDPAGGWRTLINGDSLGTREGAEPVEAGPEDRGGLVFWYQGGSGKRSDAFFTHGGFFSPDFPGAPALGRASVKPTRFALAHRTAGLRSGRRAPAVFRYRLSEPSDVSISIVRRRERTAARRCARHRPAAGKRQGCLSEQVARFAYEAKKGWNRTPFFGQVAPKRWLRPGRYRATIQARDVAGRASGKTRVSFTVRLRRSRARVKQ